MKLRIGLSRASSSSRYQNYFRWFEGVDDDIEFVDLYAANDPTGELDEMDGLILTGGGDMHPKLYAKESTTDVCDGIDERRDAIELEAVERAFAVQMPVLGVCRGLQVINVHFGGSLVPDIAGVDGYDQNHLRREDGGDNFHTVYVRNGSLLGRACQSAQGQVNSTHHQVIDELGSGLSVTAESDDGVIEAIEWLEPESRSWMLAVQWHPERMEAESPFSYGLREAFLIEAHGFRIFRNSTPPMEKEEPPHQDRGGENDGDSILPIVQ